jgi:hypothetical protein
MRALINKPVSFVMSIVIHLINLNNRSFLTCEVINLTFLTVGINRDLVDNVLTLRHQGQYECVFNKCVVVTCHSLNYYS